MRFEGDRSFAFQYLGQFGNQQDAIHEVLLDIGRALENLPEATQQRLKLGAGIADDQRADCRTTNDAHFDWQRMQDHAHVAA